MLYLKTWALKEAYAEIQDTVSGPRLTSETSIFTGMTSFWQALKNSVLAFVCTYTEAERVREYL